VTAHSPYGGSSASRYMKCPGSIALSAHAPPDKSSPYAAEGTAAHALAEKCLLAGVADAAKYLGQPIGEGITVTAEMVAAVNVYLDFVWTEASVDSASELEVEQRFALTVEAADKGEVFGTNDACIYLPATRKLILVDYKHGAGVLVDVEDSIQLKFYAIGALQSHPEWNVREIELVIVQPRAFNAHGDGEGILRWSLPMAEIIEFPYELNEAITACKQPDAPLVSGDHCRWCPASTICTAREQDFVTACRADFAGLDLIGLADMPADPSRLALDFNHTARIVAAYDRLGSWIGDLCKAMDEHLLAGGLIEGWKVVEAVSRRKWIADESEISGFLELMYDVSEDLTRPRQLVTITEAKRLLKATVPKAEYAEAEKALTLQFTIKESKGLVTAPESDKRAGVLPVAAEFGSVMLGAD
jgi:hypothetical protein